MTKPSLKRAFLEKGELLGEILLQPFNRFASLQAAGGILILLVTVLALILMNSSMSGWYEWVRHSHLEVRTGGVGLDKSLHFWINEGLMAIFFFVVGLEIKREILVGELSSLRQAILPVAAAIGGMVAPALIFNALNADGPWSSGWGIPMATDIAFTLGALTALGSRVPYSLKIFVAALAIVDDLGAVAVIAVFYTGQLAIDYLLASGALLAVLVAFNILGYRRPLPYIIIGLLLWWTVYMSGVHSTVAGILAAFTIPARSRYDTDTFLNKAYRILERFKCAGICGYTMYTNEEHQDAVRRLEKLCSEVETPLQRIEHFLEPWVVFLVVPLFALVNAGVTIDWARMSDSLSSPLSLGIILGLVAGKQLGIAGAVLITLKSGLATLPAGTNLGQVYGAAILCGVGFTMSIFVADLAFGESLALESAKLSILIASLMSFIMGLLVMLAASPRAVRQE
jgi:Na+:H+ antiporter, NhaA family